MNKNALIFSLVIAIVSLLVVGYIAWSHPELMRPSTTTTTVAEVKPAPSPVKEEPAPAPTAAAQANAASVDKSNPFNQLEELHSGNQDTLLFQRQGQVSLLIIYDSRRDEAFQRKQAQIMVDQIPNYSGKVDFYRMDISKPDAGQLWQMITKRPLKDFDGGPCYVLVVLSTNPNTTNRAIAVVDALDDDRLELSHSMNATRIQSDIYRQTKILPNDYKPATPAAAPTAPQQ